MIDFLFLSNRARTVYKTPQMLLDKHPTTQGPTRERERERERETERDRDRDRETDRETDRGREG